MIDDSLFPCSLGWAEVIAMKIWGTKTLEMVNKMVGGPRINAASPQQRHFSNWRVYGLKMIFESASRRWSSYQGMAEMNVRVVKVQQDETEEGVESETDRLSSLFRQSLRLRQGGAAADEGGSSATKKTRKMKWRIEVTEFSTYDQYDKETGEKGVVMNLFLDPEKMEAVRDRIFHVAFEGHGDRRQAADEGESDEDDGLGPPHESSFCEACRRGVCKKTRGLLAA